MTLVPIRPTGDKLIASISSHVEKRVATILSFPGISLGVKTFTLYFEMGKSVTFKKNIGSLISRSKPYTCSLIQWE